MHPEIIRRRDQTNQIRSGMRKKSYETKDMSKARAKKRQKAAAESAEVGFMQLEIVYRDSTVGYSFELMPTSNLRLDQKNI